MAAFGRSSYFGDRRAPSAEHRPGDSRVPTAADADRYFRRYDAMVEALARTGDG